MPASSPDVAASRPARLAGALLLAVALAGAVLALQGRVGAVEEAGGLPGPAASAFVVAVNLAGNALLVDAWRTLVAAVGPRLAFRAAARVWTVSQLARYTVGAAQVPGRAVAGRRHGIGVAAGSLTTLVEIAWGTSLTAVVVLATAPAWLPADGSLDWVALGALAPAGVLVAGLLAPGPLLALLARALDAGPLRRLGGGRAAAALAEVRVDRRLALGVSLRYAVVVGLRIVAALVLYRAVGGDAAADWAAVAGAWALGQVVGQAAVFAPGGLGFREGATALVLTPLIGAEPALLLVALIRLAEVVAELAGLPLARLLSTRGTAATPPPG